MMRCRIFIVKRRKGRFFRTIEWHSYLHKGETGIDFKLKKITPDSLYYLRNFGNDFIVDILLFMEPKYAQRIINEVAKQINERYENFVNAYPKSKDKVKISFIGHSLGCIILWDLLSHQNNSKPTHLLGGRNLDYPRLNFEVENYFAFGSPIGVFLTLRQQEKLNPAWPSCRHFYNLYHSNDPIAYRIEPLLNNDYTTIKPVIVSSIYEKDTDENSQTNLLIGIDNDLPQNHRIDYMLQSSIIGNLGPNGYILSLYHHNSYWKSKDTVLFVLNRLNT